MNPKSDRGIDVSEGEGNFPPIFCFRQSNPDKGKNKGKSVQKTFKTPKSLGIPGFVSGGDGGNRTRVRKRVAGAFYERSFCFQIPFVRRSKASSGHW